MQVAKQLELHGLSEARRRAEAEGANPRERVRLAKRFEVAADLMSSLPNDDDLSFLHSGLCQTCLPHSRPASNSMVWRRQSGRFSLIVTPGVLDETPLSTRRRQPTPEEVEQSMYVGVPFGTKARLILIYLQTEGVRSRTVPLGKSMSAFLRSLGLPVSGGPRGSINAMREQAMRIARCSFTMQWEDENNVRTIRDTRVVEGLQLWSSVSGSDEWSGTVELSANFHEHLKNHAVPLDKRAVAHLAGNSLALDLYTLFAYRLPRLKEDVHLRWALLQQQVGAELKETKELARRVREVMPEVLAAYPHADVEVTSFGLTMRRSPPSVPPRNLVNGFTFVPAERTALG